MTECCIYYDTDGIPYVIKDPDAVLDYKVDFAPLTNNRTDAKSDWLQPGEVITGHTVTAETGITVDSSSVTDTNTSVTVWLSGGTVATDYDVTVNITTTASREDDRTFRVKVQER